MHSALVILLSVNSTMSDVIEGSVSAIRVWSWRAGSVGLASLAWVLSPLGVHFVVCTCQIALLVTQALLLEVS